MKHLPFLALLAIGAILIDIALVGTGVARQSKHDLQASHLNAYTVSEGAYGIEIGGTVEEEYLVRFIKDIALMSAGNGKNYEYDHSDFIFLSIGEDILSGGSVRENFIGAAAPNIKSYLRKKRFPKYKCNIEQMNSTTGQRISWVVVDSGDRATSVSERCILIALLLHSGARSPGWASMSVQDLRDEVLNIFE